MVTEDLKQYGSNFSHNGTTIFKRGTQQKREGREIKEIKEPRELKYFKIFEEIKK